MYDKELKKIAIRNLMKFHIEIPEFQRIKNPNKIKEIINYQLKFNSNYQKFNFLGTLHVVEFVQSNKTQYLLIDGQHRYQAAKELNQNYLFNPKLDIEWVKTDNMEVLQENFSIINKNTLLPEFRHPIVKSRVEVIMNYFYDNYQNIFSESVKTKRPKMTVVYFQEAVGYLCENLNELNTKDIIELIENKNKTMKYWEPDIIKAKFKLSQDSLDKVEKCNFYLGCYKHVDEKYHYDFIKDIYEEITGKCAEKKLKSSKKAVPKSLKIQSWNKFIGNHHAQALCIVCNSNVLSQLDFEAGHIISKKNNGSTNIDNILPICSSCNRSMGSTNMQEYIIEFHPENLQQFNDRYYFTHSIGRSPLHK